MITLVVARADNGAIGRDNALPWRLPADLKRFKAITMGHPVIMGRRTWDSLGRALPGRRNIVLTRDRAWRAAGAEAAADLDTALALAGGGGMVIGGAAVYALALPRADAIELTEVRLRPDADTFLPAFGPEWREVRREEHAAAGDAPAHAFVRLER